MNLMNVTVLFVCLLVTILLMSSVSALNAGVGNGKFVISNATVGEVIERTMKIYNNNTFDVRIELIPSGNLSKYIKIIDNNITMTPNSEEDFRFTVKVPQEGRNDGEIIVKFTPADVANGKNGIAIPTTMVIFATKGTGGTIDWTSWFGGEDDDTNNTNNGNDDGNSGSDSGGGLSLISTLLMITAIVFVVLLILLFIYSKKKNNGVKEGKRDKLNTKKEHHK